MRLVAGCLIISGLCAAQVPKIGLIEFYGLHRLTKSRLMQSLGLKPGDPLPPSKAEVEDRLEQVDNVVTARLEAVCCEAGGAILFVGVEEKGAPHFDLRNPPASSAALPEEVLKTYREFLERLEQSARSGEARENFRLGYARSSDPEDRGYQEQLASLADQNFSLLKEVLRESVDVDQRAIAAYLLGYLPDRQETVDILQYALQDSEEVVRHAALRALEAIAVYAASHPDADLRISPTWAIQMLNSIYWGDRTRATNFLVTLTEKRNASTLDQLRQNATPSLAEMAGWGSLSHALPAYILLGRIAGEPEERIQETWSKGQRDSIISRFTSQKR